MRSLPTKNMRGRFVRWLRLVNKFTGRTGYNATIAMNEEFNEHAGASNSRPDGHASHNGTATVNGNGYARRKTFNFWTAAEILAHRWHWPIVCGILAGGAFFTLGWYKLQPKFTAVTELLR